MLRIGILLDLEEDSAIGNRKHDIVSFRRTAFLTTVSGCVRKSMDSRHHFDASDALKMCLPQVLHCWAPTNMPGWSCSLEVPTLFWIRSSVSSERFKAEQSFTHPRRLCPRAFLSVF